MLRKQFCALGGLTPAPPSPLTEASFWSRPGRSLSDCSPRGGAAEKSHSGCAGRPGIPTGENSQKLGGYPQGETVCPHGPQQEETLRPPPTPPWDPRMFGGSYREHRKPQLSSLFVFPGQRHSPCRATTGTWVRSPHGETPPHTHTPTARTAPHPQASLEKWCAQTTRASVHLGG